MQNFHLHQTATPRKLPWVFVAILLGFLVTGGIFFFSLFHGDTALVAFAGWIFVSLVATTQLIKAPCKVEVDKRGCVL